MFSAQLAPLVYVERASRGTADGAILLHAENGRTALPLLVAGAPSPIVHALWPLALEHFAPGTFPPPAPLRTNLAPFPCEGGAFWAPLHAGQHEPQKTPATFSGMWQMTGIVPHRSHFRPVRDLMQSFGDGANPSSARASPRAARRGFPLTPPAFRTTALRSSAPPAPPPGAPTAP